ncbi:cytochrome B [Achromobacter pulmonis]|jgi:cytochrome b561|uniref:Cytochrome B n=1 Tax=Achromobacter pulmonis TaxID=1389932 RepID=A0A2N8KBN4_9BURK|nr:cytochrome b/b6 domain-containing protein [Achromobacter pulmonis]PND30876.1 cytochrome B [Achromobacter pulmonis]
MADEEHVAGNHGGDAEEGKSPMSPADPKAAILRYNTLAILFHWTTVALFLTTYIAVYYRIWFTERGEPANLVAMRIHTITGVAIGLIVILRLIWRRVAPPPGFPHGQRVEHLAATAMHWVLYFFMIVMPITGYLGLRAPLGWIDIPKFDDTALYAWLVTERLGLTWEQWEAPIDWFHQTAGAFVIWALILIHAAAALYHHYVRKDGVLVRMVPNLRTRRPGK